MHSHHCQYVNRVHFWLFFHCDQRKKPHSVVAFISLAQLILLFRAFTQMGFTNMFYAVNCASCVLYGFDVHLTELLFIMHTVGCEKSRAHISQPDNHSQKEPTKKKTGKMVYASAPRLIRCNNSIFNFLETKGRTEQRHRCD